MTKGDLAEEASKGQLLKAGGLRVDQRDDLVLQISLSKDMSVGVVKGMGLCLRLEAGDAAVELPVGHVDQAS